MKNPSNLLINLPCGAGSYNSNRNTFRIPLSDLVVANNIRYDNLALNKNFGIAQLGSSVGIKSALGGLSYFASKGDERSITAWNNGDIHLSSGNNFSALTLGNIGTPTGPVSLVPFSDLASAGTPDENKVAIFSKTTIPKFHSGLTGSLSVFTADSADWTSGSYPAFGSYHDYRLIASGVQDFPHNIYISKIADLTDFSGSPGAVISVFPGEGDEIVAGHTYLETVYAIFKAPRGIYLLDTTDLTLTVPGIYRVTDKIGGAGPNAVTKVNDMLWFISSQGRLYSLNQLRPDIDPRLADITFQLNLSEYVKNNVDLSKIRHAILHFDEFRQELWYIHTTYGYPGLNNQAIIIKIDQAGYFSSVDMRNFSYMAVWERLDSFKVQEMVAASVDGIVAQMNSTEANVLGNVFDTRFSHPETDFAFLDPKLRAKEKRFDFLEISYIPVDGDSTITIQVFVDGVFRKEEIIDLQGTGTALYDSATFDNATFVGQNYQTKTVPLDVTGTRIQLFWYNNTLNEKFSIVDACVEFALLGENYEDV